MNTPKNKPIECSNYPDKLLNRILSRCGTYYHSADLFYHELWKQHLINLGFRVLYVEKLPYHHVWDVRVFGSLAAQTYLLVSKPLPKKLMWSKDPLPKQLESELLRIAVDLGLPIRKDCVSASRTGSYFRAGFIWKRGKPGRLLKKEKKVEAFSFLMRQWLRKARN